MASRKLTGLVRLGAGAIPRSGRAFSALALGVSLLFVGVSLGGCDVLSGDCGSEYADLPATEFRGGSVTDGAYASGGWQEREWVPIAPGETIAFEHFLGRIPTEWQAYVAIEEADDPTLAPAGGDEIVLVTMTEEAMLLKNETCTHFYVVVTAR